ncbi:hypothetical protein [uncultured Clostridium sp.]|uniref:hypothetical protein n=1 Tax=uncultured Clostridium sp. TaxID=59620 RepID=UPI00261F51CA|nr:hypothetical protein [uncultured Clostridium sp.]
MADYLVSKRGINHMVGEDGYEIQRTNNYEVQIEGLNTGLVDMNGNAIPQSSNSSEIITLSTASFEAPTITIDPITISYGNGRVKYASVGTFGDCSITLNDYIGLNTEKILSAWFAQAYNPVEEIVGYATDYKKTAYLVEYDSKYVQARSWVLQGAWLASLQFGSYSAEGGNVRQMTGNLVYDRMVPSTDY